MNIVYPPNKTLIVHNQREVVFEVDEDIRTVKVIVQGREVPPLGFEQRTITIYLPTKGKYWVELIINGHHFPSKVITIQ